MNEADILEKTYQDILTIYRPKKAEVNGETIFLKGLDGEKVLEKVPCSLSSRSSGKLISGEVYNKTESDYKVFCRPEVNVKENDFLEIVQKVGEVTRTHHLLSGTPMLYESHLEIPVKEEVKA